MGGTPEPRYLEPLCLFGSAIDCKCAGRSFLIATTGIINGANIVEGIAGVGQLSSSKGATAIV